MEGKEEGREREEAERAGEEREGGREARREGQWMEGRGLTLKGGRARHAGGGRERGGEGDLGVCAEGGWLESLLRSPAANAGAGLQVPPRDPAVRPLGPLQGGPRGTGSPAGQPCQSVRSPGFRAHTSALHSQGPYSSPFRPLQALFRPPHLLPHFPFSVRFNFELIYLCAYMYLAYSVFSLYVLV